MFDSIVAFFGAGPSWCARLIPPSPYHNLGVGLLCGTLAYDDPDRRLIFDLSLVHVFVASGAHLYLVERRVRGFWRRDPLVSLAVGLAYGWLTGFGAPVVRALVRRVVQALGRPGGWSGPPIELGVSAVILIARPRFLWSRSFQVSWLCAVARYSPWPRTRWRGLDHNLKCWVALAPLFRAHPAAAVLNWVVAPVVGEILFPLTVASIAVPLMGRVADALWCGLVWAMAITRPFVATAPHPRTGSIWIMPLVLNVLFIWGEPRWRRAFAFPPR